MNGPNQVILQTAQARFKQGRSLFNSEVKALQQNAKQQAQIAHRAISRNYRPLGVIVNRLDDRIHELRSSQQDSGIPVDVVSGPNGQLVSVAKIGVGSSTYPRILRVTDGNTNHECTIDTSDITHTMFVREIDVCDAGVAKKMLVVGSNPY